MKLKSYSGHRDAIQQFLLGLKSKPWLLLAVKLRQARTGHDASHCGCRLLAVLQAGSLSEMH